MVLRIAPDSDFESEDEESQQRGEAGEVKGKSSQTITRGDVSPAPSPKAVPALRSVRKVVRQRDLEPTPTGTYDYDSDIYTEESSMGSFIVNSEDDEEAPQSENENRGTFKYVHY